MLTLEREIEQLRPVIGDAAAGVLIARERREVFSIYPELRICAWGGALLLASAAGLVLKNNLERIGPLALAIGMALVAAGCYAFAWFRRRRAGLVDDYVLLLGALLVSADVAFVEAQFKLLGDQWHRHLLVLAFVHGAAAYLFRSRMVLSLSITAFAGWLGIERRGVMAMSQDPITYVTRAYVCALALLVWRAVDRQLRGKREPDFAPVFEHFAANLALAAGLVLMAQEGLLWVGALVTLAVAAAVIAWGFRQQSESFVLYAFVYAVIAVDTLIVRVLGSTLRELTMLVILGSMVAAIAILFAIHTRFRSLRT